jgi:1-acyl-sn-glycerol-3-phosphate acyltransferase
MSESDRPDGDAPAPDGDRPASLRVVRGGRARGARLRPTSPREVARRLSALERRVERALGPASRVPGIDLRSAADGALGALAAVRRLGVRDVRAAAAGLTDLAEDVERDLTEAVLAALYRWWWRVEPLGLDRVPPRGRVVVVTNRGGALLPYEALMVRLALEGQDLGARRAHPVVDDWLVKLPVVGSALAAADAVSATSTTLRRLLAADAALVVCPEGGHPKTFGRRYRIGSFGRAAFARLALETGAPIVPIAVIGAEEVHPVLARLDLPGRLLGLPTLPVTPTFPWLGLAGLVPLPTKWILLAGDPLDVAAHHSASDARNPAAVARVRDQVRERLQALVLEGLRRRRSVFRG